MIASERYETILNLIQEQGIVKVKDLAKLMQVTETTIRRDCEELEHQGKGIIEAAREACFLRLRPILMTSFAFIMGVLPLVFSEGAGAEMRQSLGIAVFAGMIGVTICSFSAIDQATRAGSTVHNASSTMQQSTAICSLPARHP